MSITQPILPAICQLMHDSKFSNPVGSLWDSCVFSHRELFTYSTPKTPGRFEGTHHLMGVILCFSVSPGM